MTAATSKATPVDADEIPIADSAASFGLKKVTFTNLKAFLKTYLDTLYVALTGTQTIAGDKTLSGNAVFTSTTRPTSSGTGQAAASSLVMLSDVDIDAVDFGKISYRDDFLGISATSGSTANISVLGWSRFDLVSTGSIRAVAVPLAHGSALLLCAAAFRAGQVMTFASNGLTGQFGFNLTDLTNVTTVITTRFLVSSANTRFDFGFGNNLTTAAPNVSRKFVLNYTKASAAWTTVTPIGLNEFRRPTSANGRRYYASVAGTTSAVEPTWPTVNGGTVVDGTVTWTEYGRDGSANFQIIQHAAAGETAGVVVDTGIAFVASTWYVLKVEFVSGSQWRWTINGTAVLITTSGIITANYQPAYYIENSDAVANSLAIDYFGLTSRFTR